MENITMQNITLDFVKSYLRVDHNLDDDEIALYMKAAFNYISKVTGIDTPEKMDDDLVIPLLELVSDFYNNKSTTVLSGKTPDIFNQILFMSKDSLI